MTFEYEGTVSHGTLREEDLVPKFLDMLGLLDPSNRDEIAERYKDVIEHLRSGMEPNADDLGFLMEDLQDYLDECAPSGYRFGAHEGDGSDFGFWSTGETVESPSGWSYRAEQENGDSVDCRACGNGLDDDLPIVNDPEGFAYHGPCVPVYYAIGDTTTPEPADRWMYQVGDRWCAVAPWESESEWFTDFDVRPENVLAPRVYPIDTIPPFGTLIWRSKDGQQRATPASEEAAALGQSVVPQTQLFVVTTKHPDGTEARMSGMDYGDVLSVIQTTLPRFPGVSITIEGGTE